MDLSLWVMALLGAAVGGVLAGLEGALVGGVLLGLVTAVSRQGERLRRLEAALAAWRREAAAGTEAGRQPAVWAETETETEAGDRVAPGEAWAAVEPPGPDVAPAEAVPETVPGKPAVPTALAAPEPEPEPEPWSGSALDAADRAGAPAGDGLLGRLVASGRLAVWVGITVLFIGVAFLLKYAADSGWLSVEVRLAAAAVGGVALWGLGWRLRRRRIEYALVLQGGGLGTLYLTVFAALRLYALIGEGTAFVLLALLAIAAAILAVVQDARSLMLASATGGFLAPLLASTGAGSHVALFGYYAVLDVGILAVAWFKAWRSLNLVGFAFTFVIGTLWGWRYYRPEHFATVEPFLVLFFLLFNALAVLYALRRSFDPRRYLDGTLVFGTPIIAFAHQAWLVADTRYGLAWSAGALALYYLALVLALRGRDSVRMLQESCLALALVFASVTLPLAVDARWTVVGWALEGAALVWVGLRQERLLARHFGLLLFLGAGGYYLVGMPGESATVPLLNGPFLGGAALALAGLFSAWQLYRRRGVLREWEEPIEALVLVWGALWWLWTGSAEIGEFVPYAERSPAFALFLAGGAWLFTVAQRRLDWPRLRSLVVVSLALVAAVSVVRYLEVGSVGPLRGWGSVCWPLTVAAFYAALHGQEPGLSAPLRRGLHALALAVLGFLLAWELAGWLASLPGEGPPWPLLAWGLVPALLLFWVRHGGGRPAWPLGRWQMEYRTWGVLPVAVAAAVWVVDAGLGSAGASAPLPWQPVLNPLDLAVLVVLGTLWDWWRSDDARGAPWRRRAARSEALLPLLLLAWVTGAVARTVHHWLGIPYTLGALGASVELQASLSVTWAALAMATMVQATRRGRRVVWFAGAGLMAVVVIKLFLVDLAGSGTLARIFSFIGAGLLLLLVGYFSPVPPREPVAPAPDEGQPDEAADEQGEAGEALAGEAHAADEHDDDAGVDEQQGKELLQTARHEGDSS